MTLKIHKKIQMKLLVKMERENQMMKLKAA